MTDPTAGDDGAAPPFERLLLLQDHDTHIDQLRHRRQTLPARAELVATEQKLATLEVSVAEVQAKIDAAGRDQGRREDEVSSLEAKVKELNDSMYGGGVTSPRELQTMQEEIDSLRRRQATVEDEIIELMEYTEPLHAEIATFAGQRALLDEDAQRSLASIAEEEALIDAELEVVTEERRELAAGIPDDVVTMYEGLRKSFGGVAVARLEHGTCQGCHLALPSAELARIKRLPADAVVHCEDCGRLLVR